MCRLSGSKIVDNKSTITLNCISAYRVPLSVWLINLLQLRAVFYTTNSISVVIIVNNPCKYIFSRCLFTSIHWIVPATDETDEPQIFAQKTQKTLCFLSVRILANGQEFIFFIFLKTFGSYILIVME